MVTSVFSLRSFVRPCSSILPRICEGPAQRLSRSGAHIGCERPLDLLPPSFRLNVFNESRSKVFDSNYDLKQARLGKSTRKNVDVNLAAEKWGQINITSGKKRCAVFINFR